MTRLAIFDLDGTLVDSMPLLTELAVHCLRDWSDTPLEDYRATVGQPFAAQVDAIWEKYGLTRRGTEGDRVVKRYEDLHRIVAPYVQLAPYLGQLITCAMLSSIKTAVVSSTYRTIIDTMGQFPLEAFNHVYGYRDGNPKPNQIMQVLQRYPGADVCYFGDTPHDAEIAQALDIPFRLVTCKELYVSFFAWRNGPARLGPPDGETIARSLAAPGGE